MPRPLVSLVAAVARDGGIGRDGGLLVRLPEDMKHFRRITMGAPIVMGRKTWQSIGRPLPGRRNIVLSRDAEFVAEGVATAGSLDDALALVQDAPRAFVIGGAAIYALALPLADELQLTEIDAAFAADTYFPSWDRSQFARTFHEPHVSGNGISYAFTTYTRTNQGDRHV
jgi:dihydrofolate reductase